MVKQEHLSLRDKSDRYDTTIFLSLCDNYVIDKDKTKKRKGLERE